MANDAATAPKLVEFRKSHPIDFSLLDKDDQAVMYISEDLGAWELNLTIANTSSQSISLKDQPLKPSTLPNHHFALRFRAGTLSQQTLTLLTTNLAKLVQPKDWQIAQLPKLPEANAPAILYLRYTGAIKDLAQNARQSLKLTGFTAAPGSGSRGTQVELVPNPLQVVFTSDNNGITGSRTQYLHVTNQSGRKNIPLHVGFSGPDQLLNGKTQDLTLRITNVSRPKDVTGTDYARITFNGTAANGPVSKLVLSYDRGDTEWELGTSIASVTAVNSKKGLSISGVPDTNVPEFVMTFTKDFALDYGESIDIQIKGIAVSSKAGHANLYVHYNNIPGYWDGQFVCTVQKSPIVEKDGHVGIGTADPKDATLTVTTDVGKPALSVTGQTIMNFGSDGTVVFHGNNNGQPIKPNGPATGLTISGANGAKIPQLYVQAETVFVPDALVVGDLQVRSLAGIPAILFKECIFYFIGKLVPVDGRLDGRAKDASDAATQIVLTFPKPVAEVTAFLAEHHLEFIESDTSYTLTERPLAAVGVGAQATIDATDHKKVVVTAWAVLSDNRKKVTDHFQGSAKVVVLASFNHPV